MERLRSERPNGLSREGLRKWGMLFLILGIVGRGILQNRMLGMWSLSNDQLLDVMTNQPDAMLIATIALMLQFIETCAAPVFCMLLVEGAIHTSSLEKYIIRVFGLAVVSEIPYNFAFSGKLLDMSSRNPVFAMALCLVMIYLYNRYSAKSFVNVAIKLAVTVAALVWSNMLSIEGASCCVVLTAVLWGIRNKPTYRNLMGASAAMACSLFSLFYLASPMGFLAINYYNGEKGEENRVFSYLFYPVVLTAVGIAGALLF